MRADGLADDDIVAAHPTVLSLTPPRIGGGHDLPPTDLPLGPLGDIAREGHALLREALRLRVRWVQELQAQAALALGRSLSERGLLGVPRLVRRFHLEELENVVHGRAVPWHVHERRRQPDTGPLPAAFRMSAGGDILPEHSGSGQDGQGAGGGRGQGPAHHHRDGMAPPDGCVLVVDSLRPELAPHLGNLGGLVAETGSVLAHVAILARECGVPTVVGARGISDAVADGDLVEVDGTTGRVEKEAKE